MDSELTKQCSTCGENKPLPSFYKHPTGKYGRSHICKECQRVLSRKNKKVDSGKSGVESQQIVMDRLRSLGVYSCPGKDSEFKYIDVVAWGCVKIEVKTGWSSEDNPHKIQFGLKGSITQNHRGLKHSDIVVLCDLTDDEHVFYVFPANHNIFYHPNGKVKTGIVYNRMPTSRHKDSSSPTNEIMTQHVDRWELIEEKRQRYIHAIKSPNSILDITPKHKRSHTLPHTLSMFENN